MAAKFLVLAAASGLQLAAAASANIYNAQSVISPLDYSIDYATVAGYFQQDENSTNPSTFDYIGSNFGLINKAYAGTKNGTKRTQWQKFAAQVLKLNANAQPDTAYKVLFLGRHGEGYHNAAESFYGTPAWNCYWSVLNGNSTNTWNDARLTPRGVAQAQNASAAFQNLFSVQKAPRFESYYSSPLTRCLATADITFSPLNLLPPRAFVPTVKEFLREGISIHTCDQRSTRSYILDAFPGFVVEPNFPEYDELWTGLVGETPTGQDARSRRVLNDIFTTDSATWISITSHSGEIASLLRVLGHRTFSLSTGAVIPVLVRARVQATAPPSNTTAPQPMATATWQLDPTCTAPPVTSISGQGCVCSSGAAAPTSTAA